MAKDEVSKIIDSVIIRPHLTEKATDAQNQKAPIYTFRVARAVNKVQIRQTVVKRFKVKPVKIRIVNLPAKSIIYRGRPGSKTGFKKALIYLKPGEKIEFN